VEASRVYRAVVRNQAQLAYNGVGAWLEGRGPAPVKVAASADLQAQLRLQHEASNALSAERQRRGALNLETIEIRAVMHGSDVVGVEHHEKNEATELIEDFMIAVNGVVARMLDAGHVTSIRRVVRTPKRWDRIVTLAATFGARLPAEPSAQALNAFLLERKAADPDRFADVSLSVVKLLGRGEYVLERPGGEPPGHFGLAVEDYTHSTAPNRRFADLVTQRLVKAALAKQPVPYSEGDLDAIARNCTLKEDAANKVERDISKRIAAAAMSHRVGETFDAIVTGASPKGTFVRVLQPRVEGLLVHPGAGVDVGDRLRVTLVRTDQERGFIDFEQARRSA
jgi:exoribonuclease-2